jgi:superfamily II DNA/RNA helicase
MENYLHRVGRTARAGRPGEVINFVTERDQPLVSQLASVQPILRPCRGRR